MDGRVKQFVRRWRKKRIPSWVLVVLLVFFAASSVHFLRQNNLKMVELRLAVVSADENGGDVSGALEKLNEHVFHHMNTKIVRPIELVSTYNKAAQAVIEASTRTSGRDLYAEGTAQCERRGVPLSSIAQCISDYALANNPNAAQQEIKLPQKSQFTYTFFSPKWTPDAAGFSLLLTGVFTVWLLLRLGEYTLVRLVVRRRLKNGF